MAEHIGWHFADTYEWMERTRAGFGPVIITCAVNGGVQGKESNPNIPETPEEIANQAFEAYNAGASIVHIHGRAPNSLGECTLEPDVLLEINYLVRQRCPDLIINNTTGGGLTSSMEDRFRTLLAGAEIASLNMGPDMSRFRMAERPAPLTHPRPAEEVDVCIGFTYGIIERLATEMRDRRIKPEMETYHAGHFWATRSLLQRGLLEKPYLHQLVMGSQTCAFPTPENVLAMLREMPEPEDSIFFVAAIGPFQLPLTTLSIVLGGHLRVGLEDNLYYRRGEKFTGNGQAVERAVRIARELNRNVATPAEARAILGISAKPSSYRATIGVAG